MAFTFQLNTAAAVNAGKGGALASGTHKNVTIKEAWLGETKNGNNVVDLELVGENGERATIYGMCIDELFTTGSKNSSYGVWNELAMCAGMQTGAVVPMERTAFDGTKTQENAFQELVGKRISIGLQIVYDVNQDETKEVKRRSLYRVFYADGRSVAEVQAGETVPKNFDSLKIEDYKNAKWTALQARLGGGATTAVPVATAAPVAVPVAPVVPMAQPVPVAPVMAAPVAQVAPIAMPAAVQPAAVAQPVPVQAVPVQPVAVAPVAVQPVAQPTQAAAVAAGMPVTNPALAGQF